MSECVRVRVCVWIYVRVYFNYKLASNACTWLVLRASPTPTSSHGSSCTRPSFADSDIEQQTPLEVVITGHSLGAGCVRESESEHGEGLGVG